MAKLRYLPYFLPNTVPTNQLELSNIFRNEIVFIYEVYIFHSNPFN